MLKKQDFTVVFLLRQKIEIERAIRSAESEEQNEDKNFCIARERGQEILVCKNLGIHYVTLTDENGFAGIEELSDKTVICRGEVPLVSSFREKAPAYNINFLIEGTVQNWPKKIVKSFVKRNFYTTEYKNTLNTSKFPVFIKTERHVIGTFATKQHFILNNKEEFNNNYLVATQHYSDRFPMIVSDVIEIEKDELGTKEYRCWISNQNVSSISRYLDYNINYIVPKEVVNYALDFANSHKHLPMCYVLDIAETTNGVDIVEMNDLECSGRYAKNKFDKFLEHIVKD